jgi:S-adenosylmethionine synthetase
MVELKESPRWLSDALNGKGDIRASESVTEGHPDKVMDQVGDAILDSLVLDAQVLKEQMQEHGNPDWEKVHPEATRVAIEGVAKGDVQGRYEGGMLVLAGEVTPAYGVTPRYEEVARRVIRDIGYDDPTAGFWHGLDAFFMNITTQSPNIAFGVGDQTGAGDQGIFFGYATNEHPDSLMPLPIMMAHRLTARLTEVRKNGQLSWLKPDGKSQVGINYQNGRPVEIAHVTLAAAHDPHHKIEDVRRDLYREVITPVLDEFGFGVESTENDLLVARGRVIINGAGHWDERWGPYGDAGVVGRKLDVDTYGGAIAHGGGALSGKDWTKVDRSAKYAARFVAKNLVAEGFADKTQVSIAYTIGQQDPDSVRVDTFGTERRTQRQIYERASRILDLTVPGIIEGLGLVRPIYESTARNGHFGHSSFPWEQIVD